MKLKLLFWFVFSHVLFVKAQWQQTTGPESVIANCIASKGNKLFIGTQGQGFFMSEDFGNSWSNASGGFNSMDPTSIFINGNDIYVSTNNQGILRSTNDGLSWNSVSFTVPLQTMNCVVVKGNNMFAASNGDGLYKGDVNFLSWTQLSVGNSTPYFTKLFVLSNNIIAVDQNLQNYISTDDGNSWVQLNLPAQIVSMTQIGNTFLAGVASLLYSSNDNGLTWNLINNTSFNAFIRNLTYTGTHLFCTNNYTGINVSTDNGVTWTTCNNGNKIYSFTGATLIGSNLFLSSGIGVFKTENNGQLWSKCNNGLVFSTIKKITSYVNRVYAVTDYGALYESTDQGNTWTENLNTNFAILNLEIINSKFYALTYSGVYLSTDMGNTWTQLGNNFATLNIYTLIENNNDLLIGSNGRISKTTDGGVTWYPSNNGLTANKVYDFIKIDSTIIAGTSDGVFISHNGGDLWSTYPNLLSGLNVLEFVRVDSDILALTRQGFTTTGLFLSTDKGITWTDIYNGTGLSGGLSSITARDNNIFTCGLNGVFYSTDKGSSWTNINDNLPINMAKYSIGIVENKLYVGSQYKGVFRNDIVLANSNISQGNSLTEVFPNPINSACQRLTIKSVDNTSKLSFSIKNNLGQNVLSGSSLFYQTSIDISSFDSGVYIVEILNGEHILYHKLIVE